MQCFVRTILADVESLQQPVELAAIEAEHMALTLGPDKPVPLRPLLQRQKPLRSQ